MKIAIGTESLIKRKAVQTAFEKADIYLVEGFESGVPPQPVGKEQTLQGATLRALAAKESYPDCELWIGIENGRYFNDQNIDVDAAAIVIMRGDQTYEVWSDEIEIPTDGSMEEGPNGEWSVHKDPHDILTNGKRSRRMFLSDALEIWRDNVYNHL